MASIEYVVNATGNLSAFLEKAGLTADRLDSQLGDLSKRIATPEVDLKDTKFTLGMVNAAKRLDKLSAMVADPTVEVDTEKAQVEILRINTMLDRLDAKHVTATVKVDVDRSLLSRLSGGRLGGGGGGAGIAGGAAGGGGALASSAAGFAPGLAPLLSNPYVLGGAAAAGAAVVPFAATAAAGSLVTVMGGAFTAIAAIAASKNKQVAKSFTDLKTSAVNDIEKISTPFVGVLENIAKTAKTVLPQVMKPFGDAIKSISGPFQQFATTLIKSFGSPTVARAIRDIGGAFGALLKSLAPSIPSIINSIASGIDGIAQAIQAHPRIFADMIDFLGHLVGWSLAAIGALTRVANWMVEFTRDVGHWLRVAWDAFIHFFGQVGDGAVTLRNELAVIWNTIWRNTVTRVANGITDVMNLIRPLPGKIKAFFSAAGTWLVQAGRNVIQGLWNGIQAVWRTVSGWLSGSQGRINGFFRGALNWLNAAGRNVIQGLWNGLLFIWNKVKSFISGIAGWIKSHKGPLALDTKLLEPAGRALMKGLHTGLSGGFGLIKDFIGGVTSFFTGSVGGGVARWRGLVLQALRMEGLSPGLVNNVLYQMQTESGGNPNAINLSDSNAAAGDPSRGLLQTIGSTFAAYHWPGTSWNIYNPLANIAAALNYARHVYGPSLQSGGMGIGSGHGYDSGGWLPVGASVAVNRTGAPEYVVPNSGPGSMAEVTALLRAILRATQVAPAATSAGTARALNSAARGALGAR